MGETVEIRSVLKLDDQSSAVVEKMKGGYDHLSEKVHEAQHEMASMFKQSLTFAAGFQLSNGIESIKEFGHEAFEAAKELGEEKKALAGAIAVGDKAGRSYDEIRAQAGELHEELEGLGIAAGASTSAVVDMFSSIQARSSKSVAQTRELTEEMIYAGRAVPGGMEGIANAFRDLESGFVRPRNALVQLMVMTGTVDGTAKKAAKGMMQMFQAGQQDKVMALAEEAISRMAAKTKEMPPTFGQISASLKDIRMAVFENAGAPLLKALTVPLNEMRTYLTKHKVEIFEAAKGIGEKVGKWVIAAGERFKEGFQYLQSHAEEIKDAIETAANTAKGVVEFIIAHKEAIAIAFGAKALVPMGMNAAGSIGSGISLATSIGKAGAPALGLAAGAGGVAAFTLAVASFAAAVAAWSWAASEWGKLQNLTHGKSDAQQNEEARKKRLDELGGSTGKVDSGEFDRLRAKFVEQADALNMTAKAAGEYADALWAQHRALAEQTDQFDQAAKMADFGNDFEASNLWVVMYDKAVQSHNQAVMQYAANVLAGNQTLQNALLASGSNLEGGFDALGDLVMGKSEEFGKILKGMGKDAQKGELPDKMAVNFNGGQVFHVKQEFRDQDPDKVLLVFKRDMVRTAVNRQQSRIGTPFGF